MQPQTFNNEPAQQIKSLPHFSSFPNNCCAFFQNPRNSLQNTLLHKVAFVKQHSHGGILGKNRRLAFKSALTSKLNDGDIIVVDELTLSEGKTKLMANVLKKLGAEKKALVVLPEKDENVVRATANLPQAMTTYVNTLNVYDILNAGKVVLTKAAVASVEEVYA